MRLFENRKYKSGTGWCLFRWTDVDSKYIVRLHLIKTPWFAICLHWIMRPDAEPILHDHPVSFLSLILRGSYAEVRERRRKSMGCYAVSREIINHRWCNFVRADSNDRHRIILTRCDTLTLCFMGPKVREWGFHMPDGWVWWKDYYAAQRAAKAVQP